MISTAVLALALASLARADIQLYFDSPDGQLHQCSTVQVSWSGASQSPVTFEVGTDSNGVKPILTIEKVTGNWANWTTVATTEQTVYFKIIDPEQPAGGLLQHIPVLPPLNGDTSCLTDTSSPDSQPVVTTDSNGDIPPPVATPPSSDSSSTPSGPEAASPIPESPASGPEATSPPSEGDNGQNSQADNAPVTEPAAPQARTSTLPGGIVIVYSGTATVNATGSFDSTSTILVPNTRPIITLQGPQVPQPTTVIPLASGPSLTLDIDELAGTPTDIPTSGASSLRPLRAAILVVGVLSVWISK